MRTAIKVALETYTAEETSRAIDLYGEILNDDTYVLSYGLCSIMD
jgi:hypothetical protein